MASPFAGYEVEQELRPVARLFDFDLDRRLASVVALETSVSPEAFSARSLGVRRIGNATVIGEEGLMLTMGYLLTEAEEVVVSTNDGLSVGAHVLGVDPVTGLGLMHALEPLGLPAAPMGDSRTVRPQAPVILAGGGGQAHAACGRIVARQPFAGYWEYYLDEALFVEPAHPHWSGAALFGPAGELIAVGSLRLEQVASDGEAHPLNMFVPVELLTPVLDDLVHGRPARPPRPWLGVISQEVSSHVIIGDVTPGGPASRAELKPGDVIHRVGATSVTSLADFYKSLWALGPPGVVAPLTIQRERDVFDVEVRTGDRQSMQRRRRLN